MLLKFSYTDQWRHIPMEEVYTATPAESENALWTFRERHECHGPVILFSSEDGIEWAIGKHIDGDERYQCRKYMKA